MKLRAALAYIWTKKKERDLFIENELSEMGPGEIPDGE